MKRYVATVSLFVALTAIARADVGQSEAEVDQRYGKSVGEVQTQTFGVMRGFVSAEYVIGVKLVDGVSQMEMFSKRDQSDMSASEIERLLKANGTGQWKAEPTGKPTWRRWRREDDGAVALYDARRHYLYISSSKFYEEQLSGIEKAEPPVAPSGG